MLHCLIFFSEFSCKYGQISVGKMEGDGQTVRVCGLPTDIEEEKLTDKLYIHFLRQRNGGGEIASVIIPKVHPGCALITFEDSKGQWAI